MKIFLKDNFCSPYKLAFHKLQKCLQLNDCEIVTRTEDADAVIAGVCAAFEADEERSTRILEDVLQKMKPAAQLHVIGCMVKVRPDKMPASAKLFFAWQQQELLDNLAPDAKIRWQDVGMPSRFRTREDYRVYNQKKQFVNVSLGCGFSCSYCPHKLGAGKLESRPFNKIKQQIQELVTQGVETIILTGIDTASYGKDTGSSFPELLEYLLDCIPDDVQVHIAQFNPEGIVDEKDRQRMVRCCQDQRVKDLQMPVQTSSPRLLALMRRNYDPLVVAQFIAKVKNANPHIFVRTDLMAGFPSETENEWNSSLDFCLNTFDELAVYVYEPKQGTDIVRAGPLPVDAETAQRRRQQALIACKKAGLLAHMGGQNLESLLESDNKKHHKKDCL